jgi:deoxyribose-phosphate aldolase
MNIASFIDHTILKPTTSKEDVLQLCAEAKEYGFAAVCVPPYYVRTAVEALMKATRKSQQ